MSVAPSVRADPDGRRGTNERGHSARAQADRKELLARREAYR
jgi:hypothetical protein